MKTVHPNVKTNKRTENEPRERNATKYSTSRERSNANLIPFDSMDAKRLRQLSVKGGKASGAARRAKRDLIEARKVELIAQMEAEDAIEFEKLAAGANELRELRQAARDFRDAMRASKNKI